MPGSDHSAIDVRCGRCSHLLLCGRNVDYITPAGGVWSVGFPPECGVRFDPERPHENRVKRTQCYDLLCCECDASVGTLYPEAYFDSETGATTTKHAEFPCFKLNMRDRKRGAVCAFAPQGQHHFLSEDQLRRALDSLEPDHGLQEQGRATMMGLDLPRRRMNATEWAVRRELAGELRVAREAKSDAATLRVALEESQLQQGVLESERAALRISASELREELDAVSADAARDVRELESALESERTKAGALQSAKAKAEARLADLEDRDLCVVCIDQPCTRLLMPCGHLCLCDECELFGESSSLQECPICREDVVQVQAVYRP